MTTDNFDIVDTQGTVFKPIKLDPALNPYVWTAQRLEPGMTQPDPTTTAGTGGTSGEPAAVQARQLDLREPPAHAPDPLAFQQQAVGDDLARLVSPAAWCRRTGP